MNNDELDDAIDAAVRQIMRTEPPAGLGARVRRRLAAPQPRRLATLPRLAAATAFAVFVIAGFLVSRDRPPARPVEVAANRPAAAAASTAAGSPAEAPRRPPDAPAPPTTARIAEENSRPVQGRRVTVASTAPRVDDRVVSAMSIDDSGVIPIAPLTALAGIDAAPLSAASVRINQIAVRPLEMDPLRFDPLPSTPR